MLFWKNQTKSFSCGFYFDRILFISFHFPEFMYSIIHAYHIYELNRRKYVKLRHECVVYNCSWALAKYFAKKPPSNCIGKYIRVSFSLALSYSLDLSRRYDMIRMNYNSNWKRITSCNLQHHWKFKYNCRYVRTKITNANRREKTQRPTYSFTLITVQFSLINRVFFVEQFNGKFGIDIVIWILRKQHNCSRLYNYITRKWFVFLDV